MASPETLPRAIAVRSRGSWNEAARDFVRLDFDNRHRRRVRMQGRHGLTFLLDLADATALRDGDALVLDDGTLVGIEAAKEPLVEVSGASPDLMIRIAWHLGNRHLPVQLVPGALRIRRDHVIEAMIERLGGRLRAVEAAFDPEGGAYVEHPHHHAHAHSD